MEIKNMKNLAQKILDVDRYDEKNFNLIKDEVRIIKDLSQISLAFSKKKLVSLLKLKDKKIEN